MMVKTLDGLNIFIWNWHHCTWLWKKLRFMNLQEKEFLWKTYLGWLLSQNLVLMEVAMNMWHCLTIYLD